MQFTRILLPLGFALGVPAILHGQSEIQEAGRRAVATASLAAKEYALGVEGGRVVLADEVEEAGLFLAAARSALEVLPAPARGRAEAYVDRMIAAVGSVADAEEVSALADSLGTFLENSIGGLREELPTVLPSPERGAEVFAASCASCHGAQGAGDGPAGIGLDPGPSNLTDRVALADQAPLDFYRKVLIGVAGTAMPAFEHQLSPEDLWAVAWHATALRYAGADGERGRELLAQGCPECGDASGIPALARLPERMADPASVASASDQQLAAAVANWLNRSSLDPLDSVAVVSYLRTLPFAVTVAPGEDPVFAKVRTELARSLRVAASDPAAAAVKAFDSYVSFEPVEIPLGLRDHGLVTDLEFSFHEFRNQVEAGGSAEQISASYRTLDSLLDRAETTLSARESEAGFFVQSLVLLVREGMEALLIVGALAALLVRAGASERRREIGWGVGAAVGASLVTAVLLETVFRIEAARQEVLEGATMLVAAVVLLMVSYWLVSRVETNRWRSFVSAQGNKALRSGSRFALAAAAFLAVYREGFETVLFYKALFIAAGPNGVGAIALGALLGTAVLTLIWIAISRFGLRIPMRPFFAITSGFLMYMAFTFVGKGIAELQESALVNMTVVDWAPRVPWMGIYPTTQTLLWQLGIVTLIGGGLVWTFLVEPRRSRQRTGA